MRHCVTLKAVTDFVLDGTHGSPERTETGIPVLSAQNVRDGFLSFGTDRYTSQDEYRAFNRRLAIKTGDVLLTIVGTIGRAAVVSEERPVVFQRSVAVIRPKVGVLDSRYLYHLSQSSGFKQQLRRATNQSSQAGVYLGKLSEIGLELPPLKEQLRIAAILDKADALRQKRRLALQKLGSLTQSIFLDSFGDPVQNPKRIRVVSLAKITTRIREAAEKVLTVLEESQPVEIGVEVLEEVDGAIAEGNGERAAEIIRRAVRAASQPRLISLDAQASGRSEYESILAPSQPARPCAGRTDGDVLREVCELAVV